jgi:hypothetical protein
MNGVKQLFTWKNLPGNNWSFCCTCVNFFNHNQLTDSKILVDEICTNYTKRDMTWRIFTHVNCISKCLSKNNLSQSEKVDADTIKSTML